MDETIITIESTEIRKVNWEKNGRSGTLHLQNALLFRPGEQYPDKFQMPLGSHREGQPFPPGDYVLSPRPFVRNERMNLSYDLSPR